MEADRPRTRGRRARRGTVERPLNTRLVRVAFAVVGPALLALFFSISTTGVLAPSPLEPLFDGDAAADLAQTLSTEYPARVPGSEGALGAAVWYRETVSALGLETTEDTWRSHLPDLGVVLLENVTTVIPGRSESPIVVVAHRDNAGTDRSIADNASGTAALVELARGFAPQEVGPDPLPRNTLVLVSTDAGAFGGEGAEHFARTSPLAEGAIAVVVLDGIGSRGRPRISLAGDTPSAPARAFLRTAEARVAEQTGVRPALPGVVTQLVDLGLPFAAGEQGRFLGHGIAALTLTTAEAGDPAVPAGDTSAVVDANRLGQLGRATEGLVDSLDANVGGAFRTPDSVFFADRAASGWTLRLVLVLGVVPFALGLVDLVVRTRRRRLPFRSALRSLGLRVGFMLALGVFAWIGALGGVFPTGSARPLAPYADVVEQPAVVRLVLLAVAIALAWLVVRRRLSTPVTPPERLAAHTVALVLVGVVAVLVALTRPYGLLFLLPSLYAWLLLPLEARAWRRVSSFALGLVGPITAVLTVGHELGLGPLASARYVAGLATVGYLPLGTTLLALAWAAAALQIGALAISTHEPSPRTSSARPAARRTAASRERGTARRPPREFRPRRAGRG